MERNSKSKVNVCFHWIFNWFNLCTEKWNSSFSSNNFGFSCSTKAVELYYNRTQTPITVTNHYFYSKYWHCNYHDNTELLIIYLYLIEICIACTYPILLSKILCVYCVLCVGRGRFYIEYSMCVCVCGTMYKLFVFVLRNVKIFKGEYERNETTHSKCDTQIKSIRNIKGLIHIVYRYRWIYKCTVYIRCTSRLHNSIWFMRSSSSTNYEVKLRI